MFTWTMRVQLINCTSFSKKKKTLSAGFFKKKNCSLSEQCAVEDDSTVHWTVEPCSTVEVPFPPREAAKCCFSKPATQSLISMGPTSKTHLIFLNQTLSCVAAGEPHPQPHSQTTTKYKTWETKWEKKKKYRSTQ